MNKKFYPGDIVYIGEIPDILVILYLIPNKFHLLSLTNKTRFVTEDDEMLKITIKDIDINIIKHENKWFISPYIKNKSLHEFGRLLEEYDTNHTLLNIRHHVWRKLSYRAYKVLKNII